MMSSRKTTNHSLHLWDPQDAFLRTEFNENTEKVDAELKANETRVTALGTALRAELAGGLGELNGTLSGAIQTNSARITAALGEIRWVKLLDQTLAADTEHWTIDVSGIDFFQYAEVRMFVEGSGNNYIILRTNGITEQTYTTDHTTNSCQSSGYFVSLDYVGQHHKQIAFVLPRQGKKVAAVVHDIDSSGTFHVYGCTAPVNWEDLATLDLWKVYDNQVVPAGTRVSLVGLRK